jgi:hypothetical protein
VADFKVEDQSVGGRERGMVHQGERGWQLEQGGMERGGLECDSVNVVVVVLVVVDERMVEEDRRRDSRRCLEALRSRRASLAMRLALFGGESEVSPVGDGDGVEDEGGDCIEGCACGVGCFNECLWCGLAILFDRLSRLLFNLAASSTSSKEDASLVYFGAGMRLVIHENVTFTFVCL